jgi:carboxyl-terminal processing protease
MNLPRPLALPVFTLISTLIFATCGLLRADNFDTPGESTHRMGGIGVVVVSDTGDSSVRHYLLVKRVVDHSAAKKAGILPGDEIVAIDDTRLAGMNFGDVLNGRLRGEPGTVVKITILRPGQPGKLNFDLMRKVSVDTPPPQH